MPTLCFAFKTSLGDTATILAITKKDRLFFRIIYPNRRDSKRVSKDGELVITNNRQMVGWTAGAGIDWKYAIGGGSALVFGVEYLHYGFPSQTLTLGNNAGPAFQFSAKQDIDVVKGRISYFFPIH